MIKMPITYTFVDDDEKEVTETETYWFNISKRELIKIQAEFEGGVQGLLDVFAKIRSDNDVVALFEWFEKLVLLSHGERIDGGRGFDKSPRVQQKFVASAAFNALFESLTMQEDSDKNMGKFIQGVFPPDMVTLSEKALEEAGGDINKAIAIMETQSKPEAVKETTVT